MNRQHGLKGEKSFISCLQICKCMTQGTSRGPCLEPNVKFFWKRFLYVIILMKIYTKITIHSYHFFKLLFIFFWICAISTRKHFVLEELLNSLETKHMKKKSVDFNELYSKHIYRNVQSNDRFYRTLQYNISNSVIMLELFELFYCKVR